MQYFWIPAFAGMTFFFAGMTSVYAGMTSLELVGKTPVSMLSWIHYTHWRPLPMDLMISALSGIHIHFSFGTPAFSSVTSIFPNVIPAKAGIQMTNH